MLEQKQDRRSDQDSETEVQQELQRLDGNPEDQEHKGNNSQNNKQRFHRSSMSRRLLLATRRISITARAAIPYYFQLLPAYEQGCLSFRAGNALDAGIARFSRLCLFNGDPFGAVRCRIAKEYGGHEQGGRMSANNPGNIPLVSGDVFDALQADVTPPVARRYLMQYLQMWDGRYARQAAAIRDGNREAAIEALLSVRTSAQMMGAWRLAAVAARIEEALAGGETRRAVPLLDELEACGRLTMEELRRRFVPGIGPGGTDSLQKQSEKPDPGPNSNGWLRRADSLVSVLAPFLRQEPRLN